MRHLPRPGHVVALAVLLGLVHTLSAAPAFWQVATQADFLRGEVEQLSIDEHGRLMLGPGVERVADTSAPFVWAVLSAEGGGVYLGTGNDGRVLHVSRAGQSRVVFDATEMAVHALAPAPDGGLFAATSPDGRIYRIARDGTATPFFDPEEKYIWALAVDRDGRLFAATGEQGRIYRIGPDGAGEVFHASTATHVVSLAFGADGRLVAGTESPGRVFRFDAAGRPFLLLDTPFQEVRSLRFDSSGRLYAVALSGRAGGGDTAADTAVRDASRPPIPSVSTEITAVAVVEAPLAGQGTTVAPAADRRTAAGAIYRISPDGLWDQLWESRDDAPYDLLIDDDGGLLVATGNSGKLLRLSGDPWRPVLLARIPAQQTTRLARVDGRTLMVSSNPGLLLALSGSRATRGTYESEVKDAQMVSAWGTVSWRATTPSGTAVQVQTRSGNTATPDEAWSDWSAPYATATGSAIASPSARYLQWRAVLTGTNATPILTSLTAAYLQRNVRPQVTSITVHPPGIVFQKPFSTGEAEIAGFEGLAPDQQMAAQPGGGPALGRRVYQKGLQTFAWRAEDGNGDTLSYEVQYRRESDTEWRTLASALSEAIYVWDTSSVPNGTYTVRILASDALSNPPATALAGELESSSFDIDNTPPQLTFDAVRRDGDRFVVAFEARDADTALRRVEYSIDAQQWQPVFPVDGMLDARVERFEVRLEAALAGRSVVVRATDSMNNVGVGQVTLR